MYYRRYWARYVRKGEVKGGVKAQKLSAFHATLVRETSKPEPRFREPKVDLEKIYDRFSKSKKEVTVNDLQKEIKETKSKVRTLKQELTILKVDNTLLNQRVKNLEKTSHLALIDTGADLNYTKEGIIPSKYFRKTKERLTSTSGGKMQIEFKIPKAHVCQDNTCFKTTFVLVKNMIDRVILGNPFMCLLYPFITDSEGITTHPFGQPVKFKFHRSPELRDISSLQEVSVSKALNLISTKAKYPTYSTS
ncbi:hypothetical protein SO802_010154 [Lithocarpus litseifolius]|uniref:Retropepsins domain-containing protein n=1 Tax=Lithocarpus litseifolius TaxID=425828 RepID=A0AAW2DE09_9ROSI